MNYIILKENAYELHKELLSIKIPLKFLKEFQGEKLELLSRMDNGSILVRDPHEEEIKNPIGIILYPILFTHKVNYTKFKRAVTKDNSIVNNIEYFGKRALSKENCIATEEFPIKGIINGKIIFWSLDGRIDPINGTNSGLDIVSNIWYTYFMLCKGNKIYGGITTDIEKREDQHNGKIPGGAKFTKANRPVKLIHYEEMMNMSEAGQREYVIKHLSKEEKKRLINSYVNKLNKK